MGLRAYVIILLILYACSFMESVMSTHIADRIYQRMLRYEDHQENYQSSLILIHHSNFHEFSFYLSSGVFYCN